LGNPFDKSTVLAVMLIAIFNATNFWPGNQVLNREAV